MIFKYIISIMVYVTSMLIYKRRCDDMVEIPIVVIVTIYHFGVLKNRL